MPIVKKQHGLIEYFFKGQNPTLLILAGMHGDECEVIDCIFDFSNEHQNSVPDFLFIPQVSPSAARKKTRKNQWGRDINRCFIDPPVDPEVVDVMAVLKPHHFSLCLNFHEDPDFQIECYLYDTAGLSEKQLKTYRSKIRSTGAVLYTGLDDPLDKDLGLSVTDGYVKTKPATFSNKAGFSSTWLTTHSIVARVVVPEIPGKATLSVKKSLVSELFSLFLDPAFS